MWINEKMAFKRTLKEGVHGVALTSHKRPKDSNRTLSVAQKCHHRSCPRERSLCLRVARRFGGAYFNRNALINAGQPIADQYRTGGLIRGSHESQSLWRAARLQSVLTDGTPVLQSSFAAI